MKSINDVGLLMLRGVGRKERKKIAENNWRKEAENKGNCEQTLKSIFSIRSPNTAFWDKNNGETGTRLDVERRSGRRVARSKGERNEDGRTDGGNLFPSCSWEKWIERRWPVRVGLKSLEPLHWFSRPPSSVSSQWRCTRWPARSLRIQTVTILSRFPIVKLK